MTIVTPENWTYCFYKTEDLKAFISMAGVPAGDDTRINYVVTLTDKDHQEIFQSEFEGLEDAAGCLNERYGHWEFFDAENPPQTDGCSTCDNK